MGESATLAQLLKRPELDMRDIGALDPEPPDLPAEVVRQAEIAIKYEGYLARQEADAKKLRDLERVILPATPNTRRFRTFEGDPRQASDIRAPQPGSGVAHRRHDSLGITILLIHLKRRNAGK